MPQKTYAGITIELDDEGFLRDPSQWSREVARAIAQEAGLPTLTDQHWKVLDYARADTVEQGVSPGPRRIVSGSGVSMKELYQLFPKGPGKLVARIAGVSKPKACL